MLGCLPARGWLRYPISLQTTIKWRMNEKMSILTHFCSKWCRPSRFLWDCTRDKLCRLVVDKICIEHRGWWCAPGRSCSGRTTANCRVRPPRDRTCQLDPCGCHRSLSALTVSSGIEVPFLTDCNNTKKIIWMRIHCCDHILHLIWFDLISRVYFYEITFLKNEI